MAWDLPAALFVGLCFGSAWLLIDDLRGGSIYLWPFLAASVAFAGFAINMGWKASERADTDYGKLVRIIDPGQEAYALPFYAVTLVAVASVVWITVVAVATDGIKSRGLEAFLYGGVAFLFAWTVFGFISLVRLNQRTERRVAEVRSIREELEASGGQGPPNGAANSSSG